MGLWNNITDVYNSLDVLVEDQDASITLPVNTIDSITLISGNLPPGMRIDGNNIVGKPEKVISKTKYIFTLRAIESDTIEDRSFSIDVIGKNAPVWVTPSGELNSEINGEPSLYVRDGTVVNLQFLAVDEDEEVGELLRYYISSGYLPPGLQLTQNGFLYGILGANVKRLDGTIHDFVYDYPHPDEFIMGYHSKYYDIENKTATISEYSSYYKNNKNYTFEISVHDGKTLPVSREFSIMLGGTDSWVIDGFNTPEFNTEVYWLTQDNLGVYRANKNLTIYLDVIDPGTMTGYANYKLFDYNWDGTESKLPEGLVLDTDRGLIYGKTPILYTSKKEYKILIGSNSPTSPSYSYKTFFITLIHEDYIDFSWKTSSYLGTMKVYQKSFKKLEAIPTKFNTTVSYELVSGSLPNGLVLTPDGYINGNILPIDSSHTGIFDFVVKAWNNNNTHGNEKKFTIMIDKVDMLLYNDVYIKPFLSNEFREKYNRLLSNMEMINSDYIFRPEDNDFGINTDIRILLCSSVDTVDLQDYFPILNGFERRRLRFNGIKNITVFSPGTTVALYEVVYIELLDPLSKTQNSLSILRDAIIQLGDVDLRNERLWLRELRYTENYENIVALPLIFVNVGYGNIISKQISNIDYYDIYNYEFDIDRIIVTSTINNDYSKYVMFPERDPQIFL